MKTAPAGNWSEQRKDAAQRVTGALYGVVAIMSAELAVTPHEFGYLEAALGAVLVGLAMMVTKIFVEIVKKETEIGAHLPLSAARGIIRAALPVMLFPAAVALLIVAAAAVTARWDEYLDITLYFGMAAVFVIGFFSSYVLDNEMRPAFSRAGLWLLLSLFLVIVKKLA